VENGEKKGKAQATLKNQCKCISFLERPETRPSKNNINQNCNLYQKVYSKKAIYAKFA
jgi:hypothetical protein